MTSSNLSHPFPRVQDSNDLDNDPGSNDDSVVVAYGHPANPSEASAITKLIKRYYRSAAEEDGAKACSMLLSTVTETVVEEYAAIPGSPHKLRGRTCAAVMSKLFQLRHRQIVTQLSSLKVTMVRVEAMTGLVVLGFDTTPEPYKISVGREGGTWRIKEPLDSGMP